MSRLAVVVLAVSALACGLVMVVAPSPAVPGPAIGRGSGSEQFRIVGGGVLPKGPPALREAGAPLSPAERGYAIARALTAVPASARDSLGRPGAEILAADLPANSVPQGHRRVQVSAYDYRTDRLHQILVDLTTGRVDQQAAVRRLQLPPSAAETQVAFDLAIAARPAPAFVAQFEELTGAPLLTADQVRVIGAAWLPVTADDPGHQGDHQAGDTGCGRDRCVQLLVALPSGRFLGTGDVVVDLSTRGVTPISRAEAP